MVMASSKLITNTSQTKSDLSRPSPLCSSFSDLQNLQNSEIQSQNDFGSMSMDDLLKNIYSFPPPPPTASDSHAQFPGAPMSPEGRFSTPKDMANKSVDEVWKGIVSGSVDQRQGCPSEEMNLEDFLTKVGAVREEDVRVVNTVGVGAGVYDVDPAVIYGGGSQFSIFGNHDIVDHPRVLAPTTGGGARGKRRVVEEPPLDKATQQKQRRMIKNRESAARSRERKQAYTVELESLVTQLEEEHARLLRKEAEMNKERFKQLMENLVPVEERRRPQRVLRRVHSMQL